MRFHFAGTQSSLRAARRRPESRGLEQAIEQAGLRTSSEATRRQPSKGWLGVGYTWRQIGTSQRWLCDVIGRLALLTMYSIVGVRG
jgi:hypothetical protein